MVPGRLEDSAEFPDWMRGLRGFEELTVRRRVRRIHRDGAEYETDIVEAGPDAGEDAPEGARHVVRKKIVIGDDEAGDGPAPDMWEISLRLPADARDVVAETDPLIPVHTVAAAVREIEGKLAELVRVCREQGKSWTDIGRSLGVSKQAAWERFSGED